MPFQPILKTLVWMIDHITSLKQDWDKTFCIWPMSRYANRIILGLDHCLYLNIDTMPVAWGTVFIFDCGGITSTYGVCVWPKWIQFRRNGAAKNANYGKEKVKTNLMWSMSCLCVIGEHVLADICVLKWKATPWSLECMYNLFRDCLYETAFSVCFAYRNFRLHFISDTDRP